MRWEERSGEAGGMRGEEGRGEEEKKRREEKREEKRREERRREEKRGEEKRGEEKKGEERRREEKRGEERRREEKRREERRGEVKFREETGGEEKHARTRGISEFRIFLRLGLALASPETYLESAGPLFSFKNCSQRVILGRHGCASLDESRRLLLGPILPSEVPQ